MMRWTLFEMKRTFLPPGSRGPAVTLAILGLLALASTAAAQQQRLDVFSVAPEAVEPGDRVTISGQGLEGSPDDYFVWLRTADAAVVLEPVATADHGGVQSLEADLDVVPVAEAGTLEVWRGRTHPVPDHTIWSQGRLVTGSDAQVFIAEEAASTPGPTLLTTSPEALAAHFDGEWISIDVSELGRAYIRLTVVIETKKGCVPVSVRDRRSPRNVSSAATAIETDTSSTGSRWALEVTVQADQALATPEGLAAAIAEVLNEQFGSLGLSASSDGSILTICVEDCMSFGAAVLSSDEAETMVVRRE
ncbi:MAG: hypothetical protein AAGD06_24945 [Acidobacteriota bacterium]